MAISKAFYDAFEHMIEKRKAENVGKMVEDEHTTVHMKGE